MTQKKADPPQFPAVIELPQVDSTNNYALSRIREGLAYHGMSIFAHEQLAGKGQRGKKWVTAPGQSIHLSLALTPKSLKLDHLFALSTLVAVETRAFLADLAPGDWFIKWPNDIYFQDRKAVGMLIENILSGQKWKWAVAGIGINMNQDRFPDELKQAVSLKQVTGKHYDCLELATGLAERIFYRFRALEAGFEHSFPAVLEQYNRFLFKQDQEVTFRHEEGTVFSAVVRAVNGEGKLLLEGAPKPVYDFGELAWLVS
ncbi:biotin--[acetyl-CoA-carboxylase] ligase [Niabella drilacis]|uniref:BirA family transcriptional regulator, biotin operon repressor / biotin-[acetyl-CoA-carboxylase] ligase n=1 Tax=Niabella drilacis (strain DSM 25811 / CCM 8410 / CCUG 62505 / LMG 26954 / E90) TaxID=1285928 RepID=A0A1G6PR58_NIADE|nr:biotin--[acetyl-CoA-carboxylase] ligase [Niabella drilacis]SDC82569.1 BirA family transcriptional regulator, biotin operon repressor / biotin-[acetyl-CoA-carboxylase] ligase [Niabella drilacis]